MIIYCRNPRSTVKDKNGKVYQVEDYEMQLPETVTSAQLKKLFPNFIHELSLTRFEGS